MLYYYYYYYCEYVMIALLLSISYSDSQAQKWQNTSTDERLSVGYFQLSKKWEVQDVSQESLSFSNL